MPIPGTRDFFCIRNALGHNDSAKGLKLVVSYTVFYADS